ncbi:MAG: recombination protein RecR [Rhodospirillales bacterium]|nr:recombination protein RecR [Alphaproteobacteria bacterium]USO03973.1 MAG: recombination protein RecR [Rhodospirillales bacterium]
MPDGPLDKLVKQLAALPGLGSRSAKRMALHLLTHKEELMIPLAESLKETAQTVRTCRICNTLDSCDPCRICRDSKRRHETICVVGNVADLWAIERTGYYQDLYHVLGGVLSALDGVGPEDLSIDPLVERVRENNIQEVILALGATVDGQTTAHVIMDRLHDLDVNVTRLAHGVPVGGELDYLDDGTIATALKSRSRL